MLDILQEYFVNIFQNIADVSFSIYILAIFQLFLPKIILADQLKDAQSLFNLPV